MLPIHETISQAAENPMEYLTIHPFSPWLLQSVKINFDSSGDFERRSVILRKFALNISIFPMFELEVLKLLKRCQFHLALPCVIRRSSDLAKIKITF